MEKRKSIPANTKFAVTDEDYRRLARERFQDEGSLEIDESAVVSRGIDDGAYVQAWVWVSNRG
jgi:hypothetical protein